MQKDGETVEAPLHFGPRGRPHLRPRDCLRECGATDTKKRKAVALALAERLTFVANLLDSWGICGIPGKSGGFLGNLSDPWQIFRTPGKSAGFLANLSDSWEIGRIRVKSVGILKICRIPGGSHLSDSWEIGRDVLHEFP
jgi:hypothetical protein